jgi:hypothetical protein|tara:strand:- start:447 stop:626 length:180 start_codon:yes stop_codon:yes gene_type:complete
MSQSIEVVSLQRLFEELLKVINSQLSGNLEAVVDLLDVKIGKIKLLAQNALLEEQSSRL